MQWDLGVQGLAVLGVMSILFGAFAQLVFWGRALPLIALGSAVASFAVGLLISEVWFGWATEAELQPNIDGLSFDEVLIGYLVGVPIVFLARWATSRRREEVVSFR